MPQGWMIFQSALSQPTRRSLGLGWVLEVKEAGGMEFGAGDRERGAERGSEESSHHRSA